jgi:hypothetical protein
MLYTVVYTRNQDIQLTKIVIACLVTKKGAHDRNRIKLPLSLTLEIHGFGKTIVSNSASHVFTK